MTTYDHESIPPAGGEDRYHFRRLLMIWVPITLAGLAAVIWGLGPILPPGNGSVEAHGQQVDNTVLLACAVPVMTTVLVYLGYALVMWRDRASAPVADGPGIRGHAGVQMWWLVTTTVLVLFLAGYGTVRMLADGSGGGQGPNPIATPGQASHDSPLQVQVIAQQWQFTYRWPAYGGFETSSIELPAHTLVELHVTSLDVVHSFWAYQLGVKADANPGEDNVAYVTTNGPLTFNIRCAELCGVWHGYMYARGHVVPKAEFASWIAGQRQRFAPIQKSLTPYEKTYFPAPGRRSG
jgi:cytochrome c oxidase subunit 2